MLLELFHIELLNRSGTEVTKMTAQEVLHREAMLLGDMRGYL